MPAFRFALTLSVTLLVSACATSTQDPGPAAAAAPAAPAATTPVEASAMAANDKDRVVCKEIKKTGTRFGTRQCLKVSQWEAIREGSREALSETQRRASQHYQDNAGG